MGFEGLTSRKARELLKIYGKNNYDIKILRSAWKIFFSQLTSPLIYLLVVASVIAYFVGEPTEALVIIFIVLINAVLGFLQEYKAEQIKRELMKYAPRKVRVFRDGNLVTINAEDLVPGDIIKLNIGDLVPADAEILESDSLTVNESQLTGESRPVQKGVNVAKGIYPSNMVYAGSSVSSGEGVAVVVNTGVSTEFGKLGSKVLTTGSATDFEDNLGKFNNYLLKVIGGIALFVLVINALKGSFLNSLLFTLAVIVGVLPESLPIVITISLSQAALLMAKNKVVVKRLSSIEDLGNMDTLCCDKTGTLTEGKLKLIKHINIDGKEDDNVLIQGILCNNSNNPIDNAILTHPAGAKVRKSLENYKIIDRNEFDFERKRMSVLAESNGNKFLIAKGEPLSVLKACSFAMIKKKKTRISLSLLKTIQEKIRNYEQEGYKVIATAFKELRKSDSSHLNERNLLLTGFLIFLDPPKRSVKSTLKKLKELDISIKIISGDSDLITKRVCLDAGFEINERVITGEELEKLNSSQFHKYCEKYNVFARVKPLLKHRIIQSLNKEGRTIGFLGDGVNDAPSIKAADVGLSVNSAVGIAREAADILLLKKSLKAIVDGVLLGRKVFLNIIKYIKNTMSANFGNVFTITIASTFLKFVPMLSSQVLLNNLITDTPLMTISTDNVEKNLLKSPHKWDFKAIRTFMLYFGIISSLVDFLVIVPLLFLNVGINLFRTVWFVESSLSEIIITFIIRTKKVFFRGRPSRMLLAVSVFSMAFIIGVVYTSIGEKVFHFIPIPLSLIMLISCALAIYVVLAEFLKKRLINLVP